MNKHLHPDVAFAIDAQQKYGAKPDHSDIERMVSALENNEWADHCGTTPLGRRLEAQITRLLTELHDARATALAEAADAVSAHDRAGREWVKGSLWGTLTNEAVARIKELAEGQAIRVQYIEGVGTVAVMEPK